MGKNRSFKKPSIKKTPRFSLPEIPNYEIRKPAFSFREMRYGGAACLSKCIEKEKADVVEALLKISQITWKDLHSEPHDRYGYEKIPVSQFKVPLPPTATQETKLWVFRFSLPGRIAGYKLQDIFHIVAVGAHHQLY